MLWKSLSSHLPLFRLPSSLRGSSRRQAGKSTTWSTSPIRFLSVRHVDPPCIGLGRFIRWLPVQLHTYVDLVNFLCTELKDCGHVPQRHLFDSPRFQVVLEMVDIVRFDVSASCSPRQPLSASSQYAQTWTPSRHDEIQDRLEEGPHYAWLSG